MKRTNESGRSMVEMLGVLAIIGVLSIGGIAGYSMAMNRYRANEILDAASKYAVIVYSASETYKTMNNGGTLDTLPTFEKSGLNCPSGVSNPTSSDKGCKIKPELVDGYSGVKMTITFEDNAEGVCKAAKSILGITATADTDDEKCTDTASCSGSGSTIVYCFKQS